MDIQLSVNLSEIWVWFIGIVLLCATLLSAAVFCWAEAQIGKQTKVGEQP